MNFVRSFSERLTGKNLGCALVWSIGPVFDSGSVIHYVIALPVWLIVIAICCQSYQQNNEYNHEDSILAFLSLL